MLKHDFCRKSITSTLKSLKWQLFLLPNLNDSNANIFSFKSFTSGQTSYCTVKSILSIAAHEAKHFHITLVYAECWTRIGFQTVWDVTYCTQSKCTLSALIVKTAF